MSYTHKQLTEAELIAEIQEISGGAKSSFVTEETNPTITGTSNPDEMAMTGIPVILEPKRKRGRPLGSRNKPKEIK